MKNDLSDRELFLITHALQRNADDLRSLAITLGGNSTMLGKLFTTDAELSRVLAERFSMLQESNRPLHVVR